jgi:cell wall-associated NlpC family hydrolase
MHKWLSIFLLTVCAGAHAGPSASVEDDLDRFMEDEGLLTQWEQVSQKVTDRASDLVVTAMGFLGVPYRWGGNSAATGFDCSGFVHEIYKQTAGLILPRQSKDQAAATQTIDKQDLHPGYLVFFNTMRHAFSHVGIYVGDGKFIHSPRPGAQVRVEDMGKNYWSRRFDGARRVLSLSSAAQPQPTQP